jgi:hypothetical protein
LYIRTSQWGTLESELKTIRASLTMAAVQDDVDTKPSWCWQMSQSGQELSPGAPALAQCAGLALFHSPGSLKLPPLCVHSSARGGGHGTVLGQLGRMDQYGVGRMRTNCNPPAPHSTHSVMTFAFTSGATSPLEPCRIWATVTNNRRIWHPVANPKSSNRINPDKMQQCETTQCFEFLRVLLESARDRLISCEEHRLLHQRCVTKHSEELGGDSYRSCVHSLPRN